MKAVVFRCLILATAVLVDAGCDDNRSAAIEVGPIAPPQPLVFYDETGDPSEKTPLLSDAELGEIADAIAFRTKDPIWLIRVKPSFSSGARAGVLVYLAPDKQTPRVRTGHAYSIPVLGERQSISASWKYIQVSKPDEVFTERLTRPSVIDMPFGWPDAVVPETVDSATTPEDEIVRIVDFVRRPSSYENSPGQGIPPKHRVAQDIQQLPILSLRRSGDTIHVEFGFLHTGLWGRGIGVTVVCTTDGYAITAWGMWVS